MTREQYEDLKENIISAISTAWLWDCVQGGREDRGIIKVAISPDFDCVYCSDSNGEWYEEYTPNPDWYVHEVKDDDEAEALADYYFNKAE